MVVRAGELLLLPHNDVHAFGSDLDVAPFSQPDEVKSKAAGEFTRIELGGGGESTQLLCGYLGSEYAFGPLLSSLPAVLKLDVRSTPLGSWIESSFRFAVSQIAAGRVGSATVIAKLSELLFVEAVSHYIAGLPEDRQGWLAGLRDPHIGRALTLLHASPAKAWSAETPPRWGSRARGSPSDHLSGRSPPMRYLTTGAYISPPSSCVNPRQRWKVGFGIGYERPHQQSVQAPVWDLPAAWRRRGLKGEERSS
jgi:hypothetical protein